MLVVVLAYDPLVLVALLAVDSVVLAAHVERVGEVVNPLSEAHGQIEASSGQHLRNRVLRSWVAHDYFAVNWRVLLLEVTNSTH